MAWTQLDNDTFTGAGITSISTRNSDGGGSWTQLGVADLNIFDNAVYGAAAALYDMHSAAAADKQAAEIKVGDPSTVPGVCLLLTKTGSDVTGYFLSVFGTFGTYLYKFTGSGVTKTEINHDTTQFAQNDVLRVEVSSGTFTIYKNGSSVWTQADSTYTSGKLGVGVASGGVYALDNWVGYEDAGSGGGVVTSPFWWERAYDLAGGF